METMNIRLRKAEKKANPLIDKWENMSFEEKLSYIKNNREQYNKEKNIIHRYYNLHARSEGFSRGIDHAGKELKQNDNRQSNHAE